MSLPRLVIHEPEHRRRAIASENDPLATQAYDHNARAYFDFLRREGRKQGLEIETDQQDLDVLIALDGESADRRRLHEWFEEQPGIWDWLPGADARGAPPPGIPRG